jgi:hypothetical protein
MLNRGNDFVKNFVQIAYSPLGATPSILINGEPLTQFCELHGKINQPIYMWVEDALRHFDEQINDEYSLQFTGTNFQQRIVKHISKCSPHCYSVQTKPIKMLSDIKSNVAVIKKIAEKYDISLRDINNGVDINIDSFREITEHLPDGIFISTTNASKISISGSKESAKLANEPARIYVADEISIEFEGVSCYIALPVSDIRDFISDVWNYEQALPYINKTYSVLSGVALEKAELAALDSVINSTVNYVFDSLPDEMDVGEEIPFVYKIFPENMNNAFIRVTSSDESVVEYNNGCFCAVNKGSSNIQFIGVDNEIITSCDVQVVKRNLIQSIKLLAPTQTLCVDGVARFQIITYPEGAEDEAEITLNMSDPDVAIAKKSGEIVAFNPGICVITVSSRRAEANFTITVKPKLSSFVLSPSSMTIYPKQLANAYCRFVPENAYVGNFDWSIDNEQIAQISVAPDKESCSLRADKIGTLMISCTEESTNKTAHCRVNIVIKPESSNGLGIASLIMGICSLVIPFVGIALAVLGLILGSIGKKVRIEAGDPPGIASAGTTVSVVGLILSLLFSLMCGACFSCL